MSETVWLWAPDAERVEVQAGTKRCELSRRQRGHWSGEVAADLSRTSYAFSLDGGPPRPDPRSGRQPEGVHGPSLRVRHGEFAWTDEGFQQVPLSAAVIYEMHVGTFTQEGTLDAAGGRLSELRELGVTHVELMPLAAASGSRGWGYDGVNLFAPHEAYGGPDAVKRFVDAAHARGLAVLIDVVYNHLGPEGNYLHEFGPYFTERYQTPWGAAVNLDGPGSDEVRRFFTDNAAMWLRDYHFDGLRVDAVHALYDLSAVHFLEELGAAVKNLERSLARRLVVIAESDLNDPRLVRSVEAGGYGLDAQWSDDFHHSLHALVTGERWGYYVDYGALEQVAYALEHSFIFNGAYQGSRDRRHGRPAADIPADRFLAYIQNHDQVGNRARGERLARLAGEEAQKAAAAVYLLSPFVPMIFQGEEWAASTPFLYFTDHQDPELGEAVRTGRRREFSLQSDDIPDPQAPETAAASVLRWEERSRRPHTQVLAWYRDLIALRRAYPELSAGRRDGMTVHVDAPRGILEMHRGRIVVLCNFDTEAHTVEVGDAPARSMSAGRPEAGGEPPATFGLRLLRASRDGCAVEEGGTVRLPGPSAAVLLRGNG